MSTEFFKVNGVNCANIKCDSELAVFGIAVYAGSNYETPEIAGISHFAEHMFFKGTTSMDWRQINSSFAKLGVNNNAYTSNNEVLYHTTCPKENLGAVIDLMMDMLFNSTIPEEELEKERGVITEEKHMYDDNPKYAFDSELGDNFFVWEKGHDTIGTFETIKSISRDDMVAYLDKHTHFGNLMFVCCGNIPTEELKAAIERNMPDSHSFLKDGELNQASDGLWSDIIEKDDKIKFVYERENIAQASVSMLTTGLNREDPLYYPAAVVISALGGGMYSKLFSRIREELGLCYSVGMLAYPIAYPSHVVNEIYTYTSPENTDKFIEACEEVVKDVLDNGLDDDIFECAKTDLLAKILRLTETSYGRLHYLVKSYLIGKTTTLEEVAAEVRGITKEQCNEAAKKILDQQYNWAVMLPKE
jgi:predicted Zn-dependent peptidase